jgi:hypothetical protein
LSGALPEFHLKQPVLSGNPALREKQIMLVLGIYVSDAPAVAKHLDGLLKTLRSQFSRDHS